jgi:hypothetical protein
MPSATRVPDAVAGAARPAILRFLLDHGADEIDHPGGKLFDHLLRTAVTLAEWEAAPDLVTAGLCHAVYGTDGFRVPLATLEQREVVRTMIGARAEAIVYCYAASDRSVTWDAAEAADLAAGVPYRDRFTGADAPLGPDDASDYWTLTAANELDLLDRIRGAEVIIAPLERNQVFLSSSGRRAVENARERYPLCTTSAD